MEGPLQILVVVLIVGLCDLSTQQRTAPGVPPQHYDPNMGHQFQQPPQHFQQGQVPMHQGQVQGQIPIQNMHGHGQAHPHGQVPIQQHQQGQVPIQQHQQGQVPIQHHQQGQVPLQHQQGQVPMQQVQQVQVPVQHHGQAPGQPAQLPGQAHPGGHHGGGHGHHAPHGQLLDASNVAQERQHIQEHMDVPIDTSQMSEQELQFHYFKMHDSDNNNKLDGCELVKSLIHWHDQANHDPHAGVPIPEAKVFNDEELSNMIDPILKNDDKNKDGFIDYGEFVQAQASAASRQAAQHAAK